jgi:hypothetical protein
MPKGTFTNLGLTAAELAAMKTEWLACLSSVSTGSQSYSMAGRSFTRADLPEIRETIAEIGYATQIANGNLVRYTFGDLSQ